MTSKREAAPAERPSITPTDVRRWLRRAQTPWRDLPDASVAGIAKQLHVFSCDAPNQARAFQAETDPEWGERQSLLRRITDATNSLNTDLSLLVEQREKNRLRFGSNGSDELDMLISRMAAMTSEFANTLPPIIKKTRTAEWNKDAIFAFNTLSRTVSNAKQTTIGKTKGGPAIRFLQHLLEHIGQPQKPDAVFQCLNRARRDNRLFPFSTLPPGLAGPMAARDQQ